MKGVTTIPNIVDIIIRATDHSAAAFNGARAQGASLSDTFAKVGKVSGAALVAIGALSVDMAAKFQSASTRLVTSAGESTKNIEMVKQGMLDMSTQVAFSATELATGMYTVESAGFHGAAGLTVLKAAAQGAKDENADLGRVANAVTDILVDYHLKADQAANVTSQMVTAVSLGKTNFDAFSSSLSNILPLASAVGLKFADVAGVEATMTAHGTTAARASQNIANAIRSLEKPTAVQTKEFALFGISAAQVQGKLSSVGLGGTLQWLQGIAATGAGKIGQTYVGALGKLMGTSAGLNVALQTTGENADATNAAIAGIAKSSADASGNVEGFAEIQKTFAFQLDRVKESASKMLIELGNKLLPILTKVFGYLADHQVVLEVIAGIIGGVMVAAFIAWGISVISATWPILLIIGAIALLGAAIYKLWNSNETFRNAMKVTWDFISSTVVTAWNNYIKPAFNAIWNAIKNDLIPAFISIKTPIAAVWRWLVGVFNDIVKTGKQVFASLQAWWKTHGEQIKTIVTVWWNAIKVEFKLAWAAITAIVKLGWAAIQLVFGVAFAVISGVVKIGWAFLTGLFKIAWSAITNVIKIAWNTIVGIFSIFIDIITGHWKQAWKDLKTAASNIWDSIKSYFKTVWDSIVGTLFTVIGNISSVWSGVYNAIVGPIVDAYNTVVGYINDIRSALSSIPVIGGIFGGWANGGNIGAFATGGVVGSVGAAASGGARSGMVMVGEHGRELIKLSGTATGSRVYSNPDTERMMAQGGGGNQPITVQFIADGSAAAMGVVELLRTSVRARGGNVQKVLGHS